MKKEQKKVNKKFKKDTYESADLDTFNDCYLHALHSVMFPKKKGLNYRKS